MMWLFFWTQKCTLIDSWLVNHNVSSLTLSRSGLLACVDIWEFPWFLIRGCCIWMITYVTSDPTLTSYDILLTAHPSVCWGVLTLLKLENSYIVEDGETLP